MGIRRPRPRSPTPTLADHPALQHMHQAAYWLPWRMATQSICLELLVSDQPGYASTDQVDDDWSCEAARLGGFSANRDFHVQLCRAQCTLARLGAALAQHQRLLSQFQAGCAPAGYKAFFPTPAASPVNPLRTTPQALQAQWADGAPETHHEPSATEQRLQQELAVAAKRNKDLAERGEGLGRAAAAVGAELRDVTDARAALAEQLQKVEQKAKLLEGKLAQAIAQRKQSEGRASSLVSERDSLNGQVASLTAEIAALEEEKARLDATCAEQVEALRGAKADAGRTSQEAQAAYTELKQKYSNMKRALAEAAKKLDGMRREREELQRSKSILEGKLADVEKFLGSENGQLLQRMEADLARAKLALAEVEADRDELEIQLAAYQAAELRGANPQGANASPKPQPSRKGKGW